MSKRDKGCLPPFVPLLKDTLVSPAWLAMSHGAKTLYVALKARYHLHNNGRLFLSQRDARRAKLANIFEHLVDVIDHLNVNNRRMQKALERISQWDGQTEEPAEIARRALKDNLSAARAKRASSKSFRF
jgi:hypothetical protein